MSYNPQAIIFDFDYTLADSSKPVVDCVSYAFGELGLPTPSEDAIRRTIGLTLNDTLIALVGETHKDTTDRFFQLFVDRADQVMVDGTRLFDEVPQVVRALKDRGMSLGIVSSKYRFRIEAILEREGLLDPFDTIVGGEDVSSYKPDPSGLLAAMATLEASPGTALYVGDSITDATAAKRAATPFAAVLSGVTPRHEFAAFSPLAILDNLTQLNSLIA